MFQATRRRLALWYAAVTAAVLLVFIVGVYAYFRATLVDRVDDTLHHVVEVVERSLSVSLREGFASAPEALQAGAFADDDADLHQPVPPLGDDRIDLEWFDPHGNLLWSTWTAPLDIPLRTDWAGKTVKLGEEYLRQIVAPVRLQGDLLGYLRVSHPWFEVTAPIRQLLVDLSLGTVLVVVSVGAIGWFLSGLAIAPVRDSYQRLEQFTADASHELRNPVATIQTNVQVALRSYETSYETSHETSETADAIADAAVDATLESNQQRQQLQAIERIARRLGQLVDDLLFLARQDSGMVSPEWAVVSLDALLLEVVDELEVVASENRIDLSLDIAEPEGDDSVDLFAIAGDHRQLVRLFVNLIDNALRHTPSQEGAAVNVSLAYCCSPIRSFGKASSVGQRFGIKRSPQGDCLQVEVSDTGVGIPPEVLPHIFDRFYRADAARTHGKRTGSGLGLAIAQAIVKAHRGAIYAESTVGKGTTITVLLPAHQVSKAIASDG